jgi:hypothetical protein
MHRTAAGDDTLRWMAWKKRQGMTREAAMNAYIDQMNLIDEELSTGRPLENEYHAFGLKVDVRTWTMPSSSRGGDFGYGG